MSNEIGGVIYKIAPAGFLYHIYQKQAQIWASGGGGLVWGLNLTSATERAGFISSLINKEIYQSVCDRIYHHQHAKPEK